MEPVGAHFASAADFKTPQRAAIQGRGYTIIANIGDQPSDLDGGFAERTYLLPNPFYRIP
jgi:acid phosphatase